MRAELIIDTKDTSLEARRRIFYVSNAAEYREINPRHISSISVITNVKIGTSALRLAAKHDIPVHILDNMGGLVLEMRSPAYMKHVALRRRQLLFMDSPNGLHWVKEVLVTKTMLQIESLKKWSAAKSQIDKQIVEGAISQMKQISVSLSSVTYEHNYRNSLMGYEGSIARLYFKNLSDLLPVEYKFSKRSRQPGLDYFNVTLNYMYGMTYAQVSRAILATGMDTYTGALHVTLYKECLVFDMIEFIRPWVDRLVFDLFLKNDIANSCFRQYKNGYLLNKRGKRIVIQRYNDFLYTKVKWQGRVSPLKYHIYRKARELKQLILKTEVDASHLL